MASSFSLYSHTHNLHHHPTLCPTFSLFPIRIHFNSLSQTQFTPNLIKCNSNSSRNEASTPKTARKLGVSVYKPKSYEVLVTDAANSLAAALDDGKTRLEIDFP